MSYQKKIIILALLFYSLYAETCKESIASLFQREAYAFIIECLDESTLQNYESGDHYRIALSLFYTNQFSSSYQYTLEALKLEEITTQEQSNLNRHLLLLQNVFAHNKKHIFFQLNQSARLGYSYSKLSEIKQESEWAYLSESQIQNQYNYILEPTKFQEIIGHTQFFGYTSTFLFDHGNQNKQSIIASWEGESKNISTFEFQHHTTAIKYRFQTGFKTNFNLSIGYTAALIESPWKGKSIQNELSSNFIFSHKNILYNIYLGLNSNWDSDLETSYNTSKINLSQSISWNKKINSTFFQGYQFRKHFPEYPTDSLQTTVHYCEGIEKELPIQSTSLVCYENEKYEVIVPKHPFKGVSGYPGFTGPSFPLKFPDSFHQFSLGQLTEITLIDKLLKLGLMYYFQYERSVDPQNWSNSYLGHNREGKIILYFNRNDSKYYLWEDDLGGRLLSWEQRSEKPQNFYHIFKLDLILNLSKNIVLNADVSYLQKTNPMMAESGARSYRTLATSSNFMVNW